MKLQKQKSQSKAVARRYPIGAEVGKHGTHFRVWAPACERVQLVLEPGDSTTPMQREASGHFSMLAPDVGAGDRYRFMLDDRGLFPDPASRFQPAGPHGPSEVVDPGAYSWSDADWIGLGPRNQILYEMHVGTFTPEGTWLAAMDRLPALVDVGITSIELMPVAEFPGRFGWGYDGVDLFAPTRLYGGPDDFRRFVDRAHAIGLGVILDVVYNHFGPDGNYLREFAPGYFSTRYDNEWGDAINFDQDAQWVREFFTTNAAYWIDEFHLDGLRLDATQQIFDASPRHILHEVAAAARAAAGDRSVYVIAENEEQDAALLLEYDMDAVWNDDFHHSSVVALTGRREAYYSDHQGTPQEFISAAKYGFLFQGQRYAWQKQPRGTPAIGVAAHRFINFLENHDQVANSSFGRRLSELASPGEVRAMTALLLLGPQTPLLFQGQEFGSSRPFLYFADHNPELAQAVAKGRADFLAQFPSAVAARDSLALPHDPATFERCKLDDREREANKDIVVLHQDLVALRQSDPVFSCAGEVAVDGSVLDDSAFLLRYFSADHGDRLLICNLGNDISVGSIPDPLIAPEKDASWRVLWSSEHVRYGGDGATPVEIEDGWFVPGQSVVVLASLRI